MLGAMYPARLWGRDVQPWSGVTPSSSVCSFSEVVLAFSRFEGWKQLADSAVESWNASRLCAALRHFGRLDDQTRRDGWASIADAGVVYQRADSLTVPARPA